jgi:dCMP deaminase
MPERFDWWNLEEFKGAQVARPTAQEEWDRRFLGLARTIAAWSKCNSRQIGAVLVQGREIISTGFNGAPAGVDLCQDVGYLCPRRQLGFAAGSGLEYCPANHAETNAIYQAARKGVATDGATLYCYCPLPCKACAGALIAAGVKRVVHLPGDYDALARRMFEEAGVETVALELKD